MSPKAIDPEHTPIDPEGMPVAFISSKKVCLLQFRPGPVDTGIARDWFSPKLRNFNIFNVKDLRNCSMSSVHSGTKLLTKCRIATIGILYGILYSGKYSHLLQYTKTLI